MCHAVFIAILCNSANLVVFLRYYNRKASDGHRRRTLINSPEWQVNWANSCLSTILYTFFAKYCKKTSTCLQVIKAIFPFFCQIKAKGDMLGIINMMHVSITTVNTI